MISRKNIILVTTPSKTQKLKNIFPEVELDEFPKFPSVTLFQTVPVLSHRKNASKRLPGMFINTRAMSAYHICLLADESCSSSDPIEIIIITQIYTINITNIPIITRFTILSIRNHIVFISPTRFQLVPVSRETFLISLVPGIGMVLAKVA